VLGSCVFIGPYFKEIKKKIKERVCTLTSKTYQLHVALHKCSLSPVFSSGGGKRACVGYHFVQQLQDNNLLSGPSFVQDWCLFL